MQADIERKWSNFLIHIESHGAIVPDQYRDVPISILLAKMAEFLPQHRVQIKNRDITGIPFDLKFKPDEKAWRYLDYFLTVLDSFSQP
jgi:hypothetical protein